MATRSLPKSSATFLQTDAFTPNSIPVAHDNVPEVKDLREWCYLDKVDLTPVD